MSLLQFLSAGKSLVGLKEFSGRYQLPSQRLLPKFEAKKNPFRQNNPAQPAPEPALEQSKAVVAKPEAPGATSTLRPSALPATPGSTGEFFVKNLTGKLFGWFGRRGKAKSNSSAPRIGRGAVQTELSLDTVKVVRNDLSDSDLEIVASPSSSRGKGQQELPMADSEIEPTLEVKPAAAVGGIAEPCAPSRPKATNLVSRLLGAAKP